jgi:hypothetical protein
MVEWSAKLIARMALDFWRRYREPLSKKMLKVEMMEYAAKESFRGKIKEVFAYGESLVGGKVRLVAAEAILVKVKQYKADLAITKAISDMQARWKNCSVS